MKLPRPGSPCCAGNRAADLDGYAFRFLEFDVGAGVPPADFCRRAALHRANVVLNGVPQSLSYFFSTISTEARVFSQSRCMVQPPPAWSNAMVKFSTGVGDCETFMSTRARSSPAPG